MMKLGEARDVLVTAGYRTDEVKISDLDLSIRDEDTAFVKLTDGAHKRLHKGTFDSLKKLVGISPKTIKEFATDPELVNRMVEHCKRTHGGKTLRLMHSPEAVLDVSQVSRAPWMSPLEIFDLIANALDGRCEEVEDIIPFESKALTIKYLLKDVKSPEIDVKDLSHAGIVVDMNGGFEVSPYVYRQVCSNGMMGESTLAKRVLNKDSYVGNIATAVRMTVNSSLAVLDRFVELAKIKVESPTDALASMSRDKLLSSRYANSLAERAPTLPTDATAYDVVNMITNFANDLPEVGRRVVQTAGYNAMVVLGESNRCNKCMSTIRLN